MSSSVNPTLRSVFGRSGGGNFLALITFLRFPLSFFVLLIHSPFANSSDMSVSYAFHELLLHSVCFCAVPLFFTFSGYLYFMNNKYNSAYYKVQLLKKIKQLAVPYFLWNTVMIFIFTMISLVVYGDLRIIGISKPFDFLCLYYGKEIIESHSLIGYAYPYNGALWYVRDLFFLFVIAPIVYRIFKSRIGKLFILILGVIYLIDVFPGIIGLRVDALFFFSIGSFLALNNITPLELINRFSCKFWLLLYTVIALAYVFCRYTQCQHTQIVSNCLVMTSYIVILLFGSRFVDICTSDDNRTKREGNKVFQSAYDKIVSLSPASFFIYLSHYILMTAFSYSNKLIVNHLNFDLIQIVNFILCPLLVSLVLLWLYKYISHNIILNKWLCGGR